MALFAVHRPHLPDQQAFDGPIEDNGQSARLKPRLYAARWVETSSDVRRYACSWNVPVPHNRGFGRLASTAYDVVMIRGRLLICSQGIWHYFGFMRWAEIESWSWTGTFDATLLLQKRTRFAFLGRGALPIPLELKEEVELLLCENVR